MQESLLHAIVCTNLLQDIPGELAIELIGKVSNRNRGDADDDRDRDEERSGQFPEVVPIRYFGKSVAFPQLVNGRVNLVNLNERVDEERQVGDAESNDLDRVLPPQRVPGEDQDIEETENEKR